LARDYLFDRSVQTEQGWEYLADDGGWYYWYPRLWVYLPVEFMDEYPPESDEDYPNG
jgi:hypothetical protein